MVLTVVAAAAVIGASLYVFVVAPAGHAPSTAPEASAKCPSVPGPTVRLAPTSGDSHPEIQNAIEAVGHAGGGTVVLGNGTFTVYEETVIQNLDNIIVEGQGPGRTVISLPPDPVGVFRNTNNTPVSQADTGGPGAQVFFIPGPKAVDHWAMCDLTIDAQATSLSEACACTLIQDSSGGEDHEYIDIEFVNLFGPEPLPNGMNINRTPHAFATNYLIDGLEAVNDTVPYGDTRLIANSGGGGAEIMGIGGLTNFTITNVTGQGYMEFADMISTGGRCTNWHIAGHLLIDPSYNNTAYVDPTLVDGDWGGTVFDNVSFNVNGTFAKNAASTTFNGNPWGFNETDFNGLSFIDSTFDGPVIHAVNMVDIRDSHFWGGVDSVPSVFEGNRVVYAPNTSFDSLNEPIAICTADSDCLAETLVGNNWVFPNGTRSNDLFDLGVGKVSWTGDVFSVSGRTSGFLLLAPGVTLPVGSAIANLSYFEGPGAPSVLTLLDGPGSQGFVDEGAYVGGLAGITDNIGG